MNFAERLRFAREKLRGLTQVELGEKAALPSTSISHFENVNGTRKPSFDNLIALSNALNISSDYLLGLTDLDENILDQSKLKPFNLQDLYDKIERLEQRISVLETEVK